MLARFNKVLSSYFTYFILQAKCKEMKGAQCLLHITVWYRAE